MYSILDIPKAHHSQWRSFILTVLTQVIFRHWRFKFCVPYNSSFPLFFSRSFVIRFLSKPIKQNHVGLMLQVPFTTCFFCSLIWFRLRPTFAWAVFMCVCLYYWCVNILSTRLCIAAIEVSFVNRIFMHKCRYRIQPSSIYGNEWFIDASKYMNKYNIFNGMNRLG